MASGHCSKASGGKDESFDETGRMSARLSSQQGAWHAKPRRDGAGTQDAEELKQCLFYALALSPILAIIGDTLTKPDI